MAYGLLDKPRVDGRLPGRSAAAEQLALHCGQDFRAFTADQVSDDIDEQFVVCLVFLADDATHDSIFLRN